MHGQWFLNQLMLGLRSEADPSSWALIGACHAECFRIAYQAKQGK